MSSSMVHASSSSAASTSSARMPVRTGFCAPGSGMLWSQLIDPVFGPAPQANGGPQPASDAGANAMKLANVRLAAIPAATMNLRSMSPSQET